LNDDFSGNSAISQAFARVGRVGRYRQPPKMRIEFDDRRI
jgi:hypothetical protein